MSYKYFIITLLATLAFTHIGYAKKQAPITQNTAIPVADKLFAQDNEEAVLPKNRKYVTIEEFQNFCQKTNGKINKIYLHWTAHNHKRVFRSYHINITGDGKIFLTCKNLAELKRHTWQRNANAVGVSLCSCLKAQITDKKANPPKIDFGPYPPTQAQINTMAKVVAIMSDTFNIPITKDNVMSHYEAAVLDKYTPWDNDPDYRWDFMMVIDPSLTDRPVPGGELIRTKANWYKTALTKFQMPK